ncbi:MAG: AsmA family protein [Hyphomicrobium sp.]
MNNALLYLGGLLVVTLAALFAVPHFIDWNGYRGIFEEEATKVLGRDVRVGGAVNVRFLPTPYVKFEKVRLADPTGQTGEPFVRIESFTMRLSGPALLRGVLEANEIELHRPVLTLALDNQGGGNWTSVQIKPGALPFVPKDVALHSVKILDGTVALFNSDAQSIARAEAVNGEFSADALKGPFKFKGQAQWSGEVREVKFATTVPDPSGAFQIKASMRGVASSTTYMLDGRVEELSTKPRLTGELTGKIPLLSAASATGADKAAVDIPVLDLKSKVEATTAGAKVDDITLTLENAAEPQLISGAATAVWGTAPRLDIALTSKWLDLDRLTGAGQDSATFVKVKQFGLSLLRSLAGGGAAGAKIDIDQVKLGGETAGVLKVDAERQGSAVRLRQLKAGLPGGSRLDLSGDLKDDSGKVSFAGSGFIHGTNLARLLAWAAKSGANLDIKADGAFAAEGRVLINDTRFEFTEASADIGGRAFSGDVVVSGDGRRKVAVTLEGARLDSSELFPETSRALDDNLRRAFGLAAAAPVGDAAPAAAPPTAEGTSPDNAAEGGDISVRILAGELKHGERIFRNVDATVRLDSGKIRIPSAKFTTAAGLVVALDARIVNAADVPKGTLAYDVVALTPDALKDLASVTGLANVVPVERFAQAGSARLAGLVRIGARGKSTADVSVDGTVQTARITGQADFDGGLSGWRADPSRVQITARAQGLAELLTAFGVELGGVAQPSAHEAELVFASTGTLSSGAATLFGITAPGFEVDYNGRLAAPEAAPASLAGLLRLKANDVRDALAVASIPTSRGLAGLPVEGALDLTRDAGTWSLTSRQLTAGQSKLRGSAKLTPGEDGRYVLTADVDADSVSLAGLLAPILDKAAEATVAANGEATDATWPDAGFTLDSLSKTSGTVTLRFATLTIQPGIAARDGALKINLAPEAIALTDMSGRAAGGTLSGAVLFARAASGLSMDGGFRIDGADLAALGASPRGKAGLDIKIKAEARSPAGLVAALSGSGAATLDSAQIPGPGPAVGADVVTAVLANKVPNQPEALSGALQTSVSGAMTDLGARTIAIAITDGITRLEPVKVENGSGSVTSATIVDLATMALESTWKLAVIVPPLPQPADGIPGWTAPPAKGPLPPAAVVYSGRLGELSSLAMTVDATDMQRELAVRQIERNVEELERLKQLDQHRARVEVERRQAIEAERAAAAAAGKVQGGASIIQPPAPVLPPVLPDSAGTGPQSGAPPAPEPPPPGDGAPVPPEVTVEGAPITPAGERPPLVNRPQPARVSPPRPSQARRTTSDEVMRSLGGFP